MTYTGNFRRGDVIRFRRGTNEYVGTVVHIHSVIGGLEVQADRIGGCRVAMKNVVRLEAPKLTERERDAMKELLPESSGATTEELNAVRRGRGEAHMISGTTMHGLSQRGLVVGEHTGVTASGPMRWRLTTEGRRVAGPF